MYAGPRDSLMEMEIVLPRLVTVELCLVENVRALQIWSEQFPFERSGVWCDNVVFRSLGSSK